MIKKVITIFHNPRCSKSRATLQLLNEQQIQAEIVEYLKTPPTREQLSGILDGLGMSPRDLMRTNEPAYAENNLGDSSLDRDALIDAMIKFPVLIERPIVIHGNKVAIGRPPEKVLEIL